MTRTPAQLSALVQSLGAVFRVARVERPWAWRLDRALTLAASLVMAQRQPPADATIERILNDRVERGAVVGVVAGVIEAEGRRRVLAAASRGGDETQGIDGRTVFDSVGGAAFSAASLIERCPGRGRVPVRREPIELLA